MDFYSYLWLREDGTPLYVGKGTGQRAYVRGSHHLRPPKDKSRILIFPQDSEADAIESERALIWLFGRKDMGTGILRNMTNGGDGVSGLQHTEDAKRRMSQAKKGRPSWNKGIPQTAEHLAKLSVARKGKNKGVPRPVHVLVALHSPEAVAKSAASRVGRKSSEETKQKLRVAAFVREARKREQRYELQRNSEC
jgi:hypothetical protein